MNAHSIQRRLEVAEAKYRSLVERLPGIAYIAEFGKAGRWSYVSPQIQNILGYTPDEWLADPELWFNRIHPEDQERELVNEQVSRDSGDHLTSEYRMFTRDHRLVWVRDEAVVVRDDDDNHLFLQGIIVDITRGKELEEQLRHQAFHDSLTGLANRALFLDRVEHALTRRNLRGNPVDILLLDLDDFKTTNDSLGHAAGDELLIAVARRLVESLRPSDTIARLGGDEFAVLLEDAEEVTAAMVAERLIDSLSTAFVVQDKEIFVHASIGIAEARAVEEAEELLRQADLAMYVAKTSDSSGYKIFDHSMNAAVLERHALKADLQRALDAGEFSVRYQPIVDLRTGSIANVEALVRWEHPTRGLMLPAEFIPLAEETGLIIPMGRWVLQEACRQVRAWQIEHRTAPPLVVNVNLSSRQLNSDELVDDVIDALHRSGLDGSHLVLEITESMLMAKTQATVEKLQVLRERGVRFAIDDFGTGYSSLSYLQGFPVDILKISKPFIDGVGNGNPEDSALAKAIIKLGVNLNLQTIAEGIESNVQLSHLKDLACPMGQGFLLAEPLNVNDLGDLLASGLDSLKSA